MKKRILIALVVLLALAATGSVVGADGSTRYVAPGGTDAGECTSSPCATIGYAIGQASDGDTINVAAGEYYENLVIEGKSLTLRGGHAIVGGDTIINGGGLDRVFVFVEGGNSMLENLTITGGQTTPQGGCWGAGVWVSGADVTIRSSIIKNNRADNAFLPPDPGYCGSGGGIQVDWGGGTAHLVLEDSVLANNHARDHGGGISVVGPGAGAVSAGLTNVLVSGNTATVSAVDVNQADLTMHSSTVTDNQGPGYAIYAGHNQPWDAVSIRNSIVWGNSGESLDCGNSACDVSYSDIQGGWPGAGNIDTDPLFVDPANGDYHLQPCSPCIDAGTDTGAPDHDFEGDPRPQDDGYDMGADETEKGVCPGDVTPPIVTMTGLSPNPAPVDTPIYLTANVDDSTTGGSTIFSADYNIDETDWSPMSATDGAFDEVSEDVEATIPAPVVGVHDVCVRGTDFWKNETVGDEECMLLAVYDSEGGFVTGGGWFWSPPGAYRDAPNLEGKAIFGFVSKYKKGASVPTGQTEFQFKVANLNFHSTSYQWLVIAGAKADYKGSGTINGAGDYGFMLMAIDGDLLGGDFADRFRIKIWDNATDSAVYNNKPGPELGGGNIVIHNK